MASSAFEKAPSHHSNNQRADDPRCRLRNSGARDYFPVEIGRKNSGSKETSAGTAVKRNRIKLRQREPSRVRAEKNLLDSISSQRRSRPVVDRERAGPGVRAAVGKMEE